MRHTIALRVWYPAEPGRIVLRTEDDWERDIAAVEVTADGACHHFAVTSPKPFLYYKPLLTGDGPVRWSLGANYLGVSTRVPDTGDIYPLFFDAGGCSACELLDLESPASGLRYAYRVYLPPGYAENPTRRYPVLYMQDGQNLFFADEAFGGEHWRVTETLHRLTEMNAIHPAIVVGVYPNDRVHDYTDPGYEAYGRFLATTLKPHIDATWRTLPAPRHTAVMGSSLGGVVSLYAAWQWPEVFGMAACMSSTFGWRDNLYERLASEPRREIRVYLDSGWPDDNYETTRNMRALLLHRGYRERADLLYLAFPDARHNERFWATRSHIPYQFFFGA